MYQIITLKNGQPVILYQENQNVYSYQIKNGLIYSKKLLFNDAATKISILSSVSTSDENNYIYYVSVSNTLNIYIMNHPAPQKIIHYPAVSESNDTNTLIQNIYTIMLQHILYVFVVKSNDTGTEVDCINVSTKSYQEIIRTTDSNSNIHIFKAASYIYIFVSSSNNTLLYKLSPDNLIAENILQTQKENDSIEKMNLLQLENNHLKEENKNLIHYITTLEQEIHYTKFFSQTILE